MVFNFHRYFLTDYFVSGTLGIYGGMWARGIRAHYYHRTPANYLDAFLGAGLRLEKLADVEASGREWVLPEDARFPLFMILAFHKDMPPH